MGAAIRFDCSMCWITDRILGVARQMTVDALLMDSRLAVSRNDSPHWWRPDERLWKQEEVPNGS